MPELPEVERATRRLRRATVGHRIVDVHVLHPSLRRRLPPRDQKRLTGRVVRTVERRGKHQVIHLDDGTALIAHFRMTGDWVVGGAGEAPPRYARAIFDLDDGTRVSLDDSRALATLTRADDPETALPRMGPEPSDRAFSARWMATALARKRGAIKPALLDQRVVAGLGNIYAAESLWEARVSPRAPAVRLGAARLTEIVRAVRAVLERAPGGRYWNEARRAKWKVYDREGEACPRCGATIRRIVQAGRSTYYCPRCQAR